MKFRYCFALMALFVILLSLTCVVASENTTDDLSLQDEDLVSLSAVNNDDVDLSVEMDVKPSYVDGKYNTVGSEVPWTITVSAKGGTARNVQVREVLSPNLGYVSHNESMGEYNPSSGIWKIGDLTSSNKASLTLITKLNRAGSYLNKAYVITDSNDKNLLNNFGFISIQTGSPKITSNITETTDDRASPSHDAHYASMVSSRINRYKDSDNPDDSDDSDDSDDPVDPVDPVNPGNGGGKKVDRMFSLTKSQSFVQAIMDSDSKNTSSNMFVEGFLTYDYTIIPILIFSLFLIILAGIVVSDKIKYKS